MPTPWKLLEPSQKKMHDLLLCLNASSIEFSIELSNKIQE